MSEIIIEADNGDFIGKVDEIEEEMEFMHRTLIVTLDGDLHKNE